MAPVAPISTVPRAPALTAVRALLVGAPILAFTWFAVVSQGFAATDESWFLQVVARVQSGETLYRDVYFNATPLSVYVSLGLAAVLGTELIAVRLLVTAALVATIACCWQACRLLGAGRFAPWLLVCAWAQAAPYTPLAMALFSASFFAVLAWTHRVQQDRPAWRWLGLAAGAAGLCFAAKQNLGLYCVAAVLMSIVAARPARRDVLRAIGVVLGVFVAIAGVVMLPVYVSGGASRLLLHGLDKATYLRVGAVPYSAVGERFWRATAGGWSFDSFAAAYREFAFLLPPVAFVLLAAACLRCRGGDRRMALVVTSFVGAGYLVVYPGQGGSSNIYALPVVIVGLAYGVSALRASMPARWMQILPVVVTVLFTVQVGLRYGRYAARLMSEQYVISDLPHFQGIRAGKAEYAGLKGEVELLTALAGGQPLFLIGPNTGFYYLAGGITNPDRFDFPYTTVFGRSGQQEVISRLVSGQTPSVFVFFQTMHEQTPRRLQEFVVTSMRPVRQERMGVLYRGVKVR